jgi:hypothetical protein
MEWEVEGLRLSLERNKVTYWHLYKLEFWRSFWQWKVSLQHLFMALSRTNESHKSGLILRHAQVALGLEILENRSISSIKWHCSQNTKFPLVFGNRSWNWQLFPFTLQQVVATNIFQGSQFLVLMYFHLVFQSSVLQVPLGNFTALHTFTW